MSLPILPPGTGVMLCGHGSRNRLAVGEFAVLADALRTKLPASLSNTATSSSPIR